MDETDMFNSVLEELKCSIEERTKARVERDELKAKLYRLETELKNAKESIGHLESRIRLYQNANDPTKPMPFDEEATF